MGGAAIAAINAAVSSSSSSLSDWAYRGQSKQTKREGPSKHRPHYGASSKEQCLVRNAPQGTPSTQSLLVYLIGNALHSAPSQEMAYLLKKRTETTAKEPLDNLACVSCGSGFMADISEKHWNMSWRWAA